MSFTAIKRDICFVENKKKIKIVKILTWANILATSVSFINHHEVNIKRKERGLLICFLTNV